MHTLHDHVNFRYSVATLELIFAKSPWEIGGRVSLCRFCWLSKAIIIFAYSVINIFQRVKPRGLVQWHVGERVLNVKRYVSVDRAKCVASYRNGRFCTEDE
jgi:hypothetical protein